MGGFPLLRILGRNRGTQGSMQTRKLIHLKVTGSSRHLPVLVWGLLGSGLEDKVERTSQTTRPQGLSKALDDGPSPPGLRLPGRGEHSKSQRTVS